jgi:hypothetical protein
MHLCMSNRHITPLFRYTIRQNLCSCSVKCVLIRRLKAMLGTTFDNSKGRKARFCSVMIRVMDLLEIIFMGKTKYIVVPVHN